MKYGHKLLKSTLIFFLFLLPVCRSVLAQQNDSTANVLYLTLSNAIELALKNNPAGHASENSVQIAEAQYKQTLSTYWPSLNLKSMYTLMDEDPYMLYPVTEMVLPAFQLPGFTMTLPSFEIPEQKIKLMDRQNLFTSLTLSYPVYTGGMLSSMRRQARTAIEVSKQERRKTELKIIYAVKKYYYSALLAREIYTIGQEALIQLETTLSLTENLYQKGSGRVTKTDYLKNKIVVENVRAVVAEIQNQSEIAKAALVNVLGLPWNQVVEVTEKEIPFVPFEIDLHNYMEQVYQHNPDWSKVKSALKIYQAKIRQAQSGYLPKLALFGNLNYMTNNYNYGMANEGNKETWGVGVGLQLPLFNGFRTHNEIEEARAAYEKLEHQQIELKQGLALQIHYIFMRLATVLEKEKNLKSAMDAALENLELTESAYQIDMVEEKALIESQIMASYSRIRHLIILFDHYFVQADLEMVIGEEIASQN